MDDSLCFGLGLATGLSVWVVDSARRRYRQQKFGGVGSPLAAWRGHRARRQRERDEEVRRRTPVYQGTLIGTTSWVGKDGTVNTHCWELYETPIGGRSAKFSEMTNLVHYKKDGRDHQLFGKIVTPWVNGKIDLDMKALRRDQDAIEYWERT